MLNEIYKGKEKQKKKDFELISILLFSVKQVAYSTYTDVKHRSYILMKHNIEKIKVLDIYIDIQSSYFLLPENGIYKE